MTVKPPVPSQVKELARGPDGQIAAGERAGVRVGSLLCACSGASRLLRMSQGYATPTLVGRRVLAMAKAAAASGDAFSVTFSPPPDAVADLGAGRTVTDLDLEVRDVSGRPYFVVVGGADDANPSEHWTSGTVAIGLALVAVDAENIAPTTHQLQDILQRLAEQPTKTLTLRDVHKYEGLLARFATDD